MQVEKGTLYLVGTPIGNLEDMTYRAVEILSQVDLVAAEDTRNSMRLLSHFDIQKPMVSYHEHNRAQRGPQLIEKLKAGASIALVTDAGMPAVSDPGEQIVDLCHEQNIPVCPVPGACAAVCALAAAGLPSRYFTFEGFLPQPTAERGKRLEALKGETRTAILYEAPHRLKRTLADLIGALGGERRICLCREMTKKFEEIWRGNLNGAAEKYEQMEPKGEFVLVLEGAEETGPRSFSDEELHRLLNEETAHGASRKEAVKAVMEQTGEKKNRIYALSLED